MQFALVGLQWRDTHSGYGQESPENLGHSMTERARYADSEWVTSTEGVSMKPYAKVEEVKVPSYRVSFRGRADTKRTSAAAIATLARWIVEERYDWLTSSRKRFIPHSLPICHCTSKYDLANTEKVTCPFHGFNGYLATLQKRVAYWLEAGYILPGSILGQE